MEQKDRYLILEYLLTFILLFLVIFIIGEALSVYKLYSLLGLTLGFSFSWLNRNEKRPLIRHCINIATLGVFAWLLYSLFNSTFLYKDVIRILLQAGIFLEVILSFNSLFASSLNYIQLLSLPLLMCSFIFIKDYTANLAVLVFFYLICWALILKMKFYTFFKPERDKRFIWGNPFFIPTIIFLITIFISYTLFSRVTLGKLVRGGLLLQDEKDLVPKKVDPKEEYYDLQDKIQEGVSKLITELKSSEERQKSLYLLSSLVKDLPDIQETKRAEQGLIDFLGRQGPGIEKGEAENLVILLKKYLEKKADLSIERIKKEMAEIFKKNHFSIPQRIAFFSRVNSMEYSNSYEQVQEYERQLREVVDKSSVDMKIKRDLKELVRQFKEWKDYEIYLERTDFLKKKTQPQDADLKIKSIEPEIIKTPFFIKINPDYVRIPLGEKEQVSAQGVYADNSQINLTFYGEWISQNEKVAKVSKGKIDSRSQGETEIYLKFKGINSLPGKVIVEEPKLVSIKFFPQKTKVTKKEVLDLKAQGYFSDASAKDVTPLVSWKVNNPRIINIEGSKVVPLRTGRAQIYAEYLGVKSPPIDIKVTFTLWQLASFALIIIYFLILGICVILYFIKENEKNKLKLLLDKDPRKFIISLYENMKKIMSIFGLAYQEFVPPLSYAELVENRYSIKGNQFLKFTVKFEEAKYSQHILHFHNAFLFLSEYNNFLKILISRYKKPALILKYCLLLLHGKPLFII